MRCADGSLGGRGLTVHVLYWPVGCAEVSVVGLSPALLEADEAR